MSNLIKRVPIPINAVIIIVFGFIYQCLIINSVHFLVFKDENIIAFTFAFSNLLFIPISLYLGFMTFMLILFVIQKIKYGVINKPDTSLVIKHACLFIAVLIATVAVMYCNTVVYKDGSIKSQSYIKQYAAEYTPDDYKKVNLWGECAVSTSTRYPTTPSFQFYLTFTLNDDTYIRVFPEEFRDLNAIKTLGETLGDKFSALPKDGFPIEYAFYMTEEDVELWNMMYH